MNERVPLSRFMPYGAPDLLVAARPDMARALALASTAIVVAFALLRALQLVHPAAAIAPPTGVFDLERPFAQPPPPTLVPVRPSAPRPRIAGSAIGRVVPDEQAPIVASPAVPDLTGATSGDPDGVAPDKVLLTPAAPETMPVFGEWQALEQLPRALRVVKPDYPDMARSAMVEGWVLVHVLVGRDGRIVDVRLDEHQHVPMLDAPALDAARRFLFEPARSNGRAVAAWVDVPFHFTLH
jgi:protein TonB